jgi:hypothetical protein
MCSATQALLRTSLLYTDAAQVAQLKLLNKQLRRATDYYMTSNGIPKAFRRAHRVSHLQSLGKRERNQQVELQLPPSQLKAVIRRIVS